MKKVLAIALCLVLALTMFAACSNGNTTSDSNGGNSSSTGDSSQTSEITEPLHFAHIIPLSGDSMQYGNVQKCAMEMKVEELNEAGGVLGRQVVVDFYDDKNDPKETLTLATKVVEDDSIIAVFGPFSSTCGMSIVPTMEKAKIPLISPTPSSSQYAPSGEYIFTGATTQEIAQTKYADFIYNYLKCTKAAMIYPADDQGVDTNTAFCEAFEELGGEIVYSEQYIKGSTRDFTPLISAAMAAGAEMINQGGTYAEIATTVNQARQLDFKGPIMGMSASRQEFLDLTGENSYPDKGGFYSMTNYAPDYPSETFQALAKKYKEKYGIEFENHAITTYDLMTAICDYMEENGEGKTNKELREVVKDALTDKTYQGVIMKFYMTPEGDCDKGMVALTVNDQGVFEMVKGYDPNK